MATLILEFHNAAREPLDDLLDVDVRGIQNNALVFKARGISGRKALKIPRLAAGQSYKVRVLPTRYRAVQVFAAVPPGEQQGTVAIYCPVDPKYVDSPQFPDYQALEPALRDVLERSTLQADPDRRRSLRRSLSAGEQLFNTLDRIQRAGLLNLFVKMTHTPLGDGHAWEGVTDIYRIRGDRIFCNVTIDFRDRVKNEAAAGGFREVPGGKHKPDPGFTGAGSFKTQDHYGNLQLTFFCSDVEPMRFKVDADIDDAAGIEHGFQVISHDLTGGVTHPYDIHQILTFYQRLDVGYGLPV
jgi:hypothetical protein